MDQLMALQCITADQSASIARDMQSQDTYTL